ncbi:MAG: hypothetical protein H6714_00630 [Myxococcales bacterium]|nr:hypothetical protein [Myxococcales bacterium]
MRRGSFHRKVISITLVALSVWTQMMGCSSEPEGDLSGQSAEQRMNSALDVIASGVKTRCADSACKSAADGLPNALVGLGEHAKSGLTALLALPRAPFALKDALLRYQADVYSKFSADETYYANFKRGYEVLSEELVRHPGTLLALAKSYLTAKEDGTPHQARALVTALATTNFSAVHFDPEAFRVHLRARLERADQVAGVSPTDVASGAFGPLQNSEQAFIGVIIALIALLLGGLALAACAPPGQQTPTQRSVAQTPEGFTHDLQYHENGTAVQLDLSRVDHGEDGVGQANRVGIFHNGASWGAYQDAVFWIDWTPQTTIEFATDMVFMVNSDGSRGEDLPVLQFTHHPTIQIVRRDANGVQKTGLHADISYLLNIFRRPEDPVTYVQASPELEALNVGYGQAASAMNDRGQQLYTRIDEGDDCDQVTEPIGHAEFDAQIIYINGQATYHVIAIGCVDRDKGPEGATVVMPRYRFPPGIAPVYVHIVAVGPAHDKGESLDVSFVNTTGSAVVIPVISPSPNAAITQVTTQEGLVVDDLAVADPNLPDDGSAAIAILPQPNTSTAEALIAIDGDGNGNGVADTQDWLSLFSLVAAPNIIDQDERGGVSFDDRGEGEECWGLIPDWFPIPCADLKVAAVKYIAQLAAAYFTGGAAPVSP